MNQASKIKLDGVYTDDYGLKVQGRYEIPTAEKDIEFIEIKGRDGELTKEYGYKNITLSVSFSLNTRWKSESFKSVFRKVKQYILNAKTFAVDDDPEVYYKIKSTQIESAENKIVKFGQFVVNFVLDPFQYEVDNAPISITSQTTIINEGYEALPVITAHVAGTGNIYINEQKVTIQNVNGTITIDSEMQNAYRIADGYVTNLNKHTIGRFPVLEHGENVIRFDGDITKIELIKNLRWV